MTVRPTFLLAYTLMLTAGCGEPQLHEFRTETYAVTLTEWHTRYTPGITALVAFPQLAEVTAPRFTSSDTSVARVSVFSQAIDQPRFRALKLTTGANGDADISLYDGERLIRTESLRVREPSGFSFDFTIQNQVAPHEAALRPEDRVALVELASVPAVLRFYESGDLQREVVAAGKPSDLYPSNDLILSRRIAPAISPISTGDGEYRAPDQLSSGDIWIVTAIGYPDLVIDLPTEDYLPGDPQIGFERRSSVRELEVIASTERTGNRASVAVFGKSFDTRIIGLDPAVTLDGEPLKHCSGSASDCAGEVPFRADWPWLFALPDGVETGTIEARWQGLTASMRLGATE